MGIEIVVLEGSGNMWGVLGSGGLRLSFDMGVGRDMEMCWGV